MNDYFLIARNKSDNSFTVIELNDEWYLSKEKSTGKVTRSNSLEAIDLVTSQFQSREQMVERLYMNNFISSKDVDVFVASKRKKAGKSYIRFDEVIYGSKKSKRTAALRTIANNSMCGNLTSDRAAMDFLYEDIIYRTYSCEDFYSMIMDGETNISKRFAELLRKVPKYEDIPLELKQDRFFRVDDYRDARNIIEALDRLERFSASSREDRVLENLAFIDENYSDRMALVPKLSLALDVNFCEGQLSIFDNPGVDNRDKVRMAAKKVAQEEKKTIERVQVSDKKISVLGMQREVIRVLGTLPGGIFKSNGKGYEFNSEVFNHPILDEEKSELNGLLTGNMPKYFNDYIRHTHRMQDAQRMGDYSEAAELQQCCEMDLATIKRRFKSSKCLKNTYRWCMLYEGCRKRDDDYSASGISVGKGDVDAKVFRKN